MATHTADLDLTGIRRHGSGWQVRTYPFPAESFTDLVEAIGHRDKLAALRKRGVRELPTMEKIGVTLGTVAGKFRALELQRMDNEQLSASSRRKLDCKLRPWLPGSPDTDALGRPWCERQIPSLTAGEIADWVTGRAQLVPATARDELAGLRLLLRYARRHRVRVDPMLLDSDELPTPRVKRREGIALSWDELEYLASFAPEHARNLFLFGGTVGNRITELLTAVDLWFSPRKATLTVPKAFCKERREKVIPLLPQEVEWLREQQRVRHPDASGGLLFPRKGGTPYQTHSVFYNTAWSGTVKRALTHYELEHGVEPHWAWWLRDGNGEILKTNHRQRRFGGLQIHDLRRTAISLMRQAGAPQEYVAQRVGHIDDGQLAMSLYRKTRAVEAQAWFQQIGGSLAGAIPTLQVVE